MQAREAFLANEETGNYGDWEDNYEEDSMTGDTLDSVESLIKKHEDFDRALNIQENKMSSLRSFCERLVGMETSHYARDEIEKKMKEVEDR